MRTSGKRICRSLRERMNGLPIVLIAGEEKPTLGDACANVVLALPFTSRKLLNSIVPLLPGNGGHMLHVGPIRLDLEHKRVRCQGREARLTPRLVTILRILMQHPGELMDRAVLFRQVWDTEYTGDTRTLDVHISWLRHALEEDHATPILEDHPRGGVQVRYLSSLTWLIARSDRWDPSSTCHDLSVVELLKIFLSLRCAGCVT